MPLNEYFAKDTQMVKQLAERIVDLVVPRQARFVDFVQRIRLQIKPGSSLLAEIPPESEVSFSRGAPQIIGLPENVSWGDLVRFANEAGRARLISDLEASILKALDGRVIIPLTSNFAIAGRSYRLLMYSAQSNLGDLWWIEILLAEDNPVDSLDTVPSELRLIVRTIVDGLAVYYEVLEPGVAWLEELIVGGGPELLHRLQRSFVELRSRVRELNSSDRLVRTLPPEARADFRLLEERWRGMVERLHHPLEPEVGDLLDELKALRSLTARCLAALAERLRVILADDGTQANARR